MPEIEIGKVIQTCFLVGMKKMSVKFKVWRQCCEKRSLAKEEREMQMQKNNTRDSNVVPHRSTNRARQCLTSLSRREAVLSLWYGRSYPNYPTQHI